MFLHSVFYSDLIMFFFLAGSLLDCQNNVSVFNFATLEQRNSQIYVSLFVSNS